MNKETNMILGSLDVLDLCTFVFSTPRESSEWLSKVKEKFRSPLDKVVGTFYNFEIFYFFH